MSSYYCRLCMTSSVPEECTIFSKTITEMLFFCMPEINVKLVNNPILCGNCKKLLEQSAEFKKKCIDVQNHIEKFKETNRGTLDLALISAANGTVTPQSPVHISFDESYRKFLASGSTESAADSNDDEVSKIMNKAKEEIRKCDDFLNLLESSTNIKKPRMDNSEKTHKNGNLNFYDDTSAISMDTLPNDLSEDTPQSKLPKDPPPSKQTRDTSPTKLSRIMSRCKTPKIVKSVTKPKTPVPEAKKAITLHHISNPFDVKIDNTRCIPCDKEFSEVHKLVAHLYSVHQKSDEVYSCLLCRYKARSGRTIKRHFQMFHSDCINIHGSCPVCHTHMPDLNALRVHIKAEHKHIFTSDRFRCNSCSYRSKSMPYFKSHFFQNHDLTCNYCQKDVENTEFMNRHIRSHSIEQAKQTPLLKDPLEFIEVKIEEDPLI